MSSSEFVLQNGELISASKAAIPALSSAASYGDGCFETWRSYSGSLITTARHIERLHKSMEFLGMPVPSGFTSGYIEAQAENLLIRNGLQNQDARLRLQVWRLGELGYKLSDDDVISWLLTASPIIPGKTPVRLSGVDIQRIPSQALSGKFKLSNGLNYILARRQAVQRGYDDAIMRNSKNHVSETTIANIFWKKGDSVYTPSEECDLLPGITREFVLYWLERQNGISLNIGEYSMDSLLKADTVWLTNSVQEVIPVGAINQTIFKIDDAFTDQLKKAYREMICHAR